MNRCSEFRERYEPGIADPHRQTCDPCDAWARRFEEMTTATTDRPLPTGLFQRLAAIPTQEVVCGDRDRLYGAVRQAAFAARDGASGEVDHAAERHLRSCQRCSRLYGTLGEAFAKAQQPLPPRLLARLLGMARRRREAGTRIARFKARRALPLWVRDARFAAAACYLMAAGLAWIAGDPGALLRHGRATTARATIWMEEGPERGRRAWIGLGEGLTNTYTHSQEQLRSYASTYGRVFDPNTFVTAPLRRELTHYWQKKGDDDGRYQDGRQRDREQRDRERPSGEQSSGERRDGGGTGSSTPPGAEPRGQGRDPEPSGGGKP